MLPYLVGLVATLLLTLPVQAQPVCHTYEEFLESIDSLGGEVLAEVEYDGLMTDKSLIYTTIDTSLGRVVVIAGFKDNCLVGKLGVDKLLPEESSKQSAPPPLSPLTENVEHNI
jgi:hypothetical protein